LIQATNNIDLPGDDSLFENEPHHAFDLYFGETGVRANCLFRQVNLARSLISTTVSTDPKSIEVRVGHRSGTPIRPQNNFFFYVFSGSLWRVKDI